MNEIGVLCAAFVMLICVKARNAMAEIRLSSIWIYTSLGCLYGETVYFGSCVKNRRDLEINRKSQILIANNRNYSKKMFLITYVLN